ncbi:peptidoglycan-binding protein [Pedobacter cryoconitis]|uniref:Peptidoglycan-binding protein n=1 Tax=Pedobacter cryoconitis TaxID=188932 RepID=A0A127VC62_9SPHI|nr:peptidoglycan-binding protein [Pedobacter cryoconitis]AMP98953.1 peptidoglycan-binding protein [Pedobacter cryoconitis]
MATIRLLLGIICFVIISGFGLLDRDLLNKKFSFNALECQKRELLVRIAEKEIGVREMTGNNDGFRVETYLTSVSLKKGQPWCAGFVSWVFAQAGYDKPRSGWTPDLFPLSRLARSALPGNLLGIYFVKLKRIAHVGLTVNQKGDWVNSVEGNTNIQGSREGDGVYRKKRHIKTIYRISDWVKVD